IGGIEAGLARIPASLEQASRLLGETPAGTLKRVHLPLLRPAMGAAALLIFVDAMKELPATLLLRPMNFETLATWLYAEAARGTYEEGAGAALAIVLAGLIPVILLARTQLMASGQRASCTICWLCRRLPCPTKRVNGFGRLLTSSACICPKGKSAVCWGPRAVARPRSCGPLPVSSLCVPDIFC